MSVKIASVEVDTLSRKEVIAKISKAIEKNKVLQVVTPYSEFIVEAEYNLEFRKALNSSEIRIPDGIGILWAGAYLAGRWNNLIISLLGIINRDIKLYSVFTEKISGSDLIYNILELAHQQKSRVYLLGGEKEVPNKVKDYIQNTYPRINITGTYSKKISLNDKVLFQKVLDSQSDIVLIALSYPKQEIFASQLKNYFIDNNHKGIIMCVGGTFDFLAGTQKRAPKWMQKLGLEWLYRLIQQPNRIRRIYKATIEYIVLISRYKSNIDKNKDNTV
jgi:N-acetylglucosaminyldiphosphoundecaprenol N-acetyl-beta-D-mannosaminyltransferase